MNDICFWNHWAKELKGSIVSKAKRFYKCKLIAYCGFNTWVVEPIKDYNTRVYTVTNVRDEEDIRSFSCNCQGFQSKLRKFKLRESTDEPYCSHTVAVKMFAGVMAHNKAVERRQVKEGGVWV